MDGLRYLLARKGLFYFLLLAAVLNLILGFTNVLLFPLVLSFESAEAMGSVVSAIGLSILAGSAIAEEDIAAAIEQLEIDAHSDWLASAEYRTHLAGTLVARCLRLASGMSGGAT